MRRKRLSLQEQGISVPKGKPGRKKAEKLSAVVPAVPEGESEDTLRELQQELLQLCKKGQPNAANIKTLMEATFPLRRKATLTSNLRVWEVLKAYPPLGGNNNNGARVSDIVLIIMHLII